MQTLVAISERFLQMPVFQVGLDKDLKIYGRRRPPRVVVRMDRSGLIETEHLLVQVWGSSRTKAIKYSAAVRQSSPKIRT
eukprot:scaffold2697_cov392-Prasinococcus_capsulatus_cf.AAC.6